MTTRIGDLVVILSAEAHDLFADLERAERRMQGTVNRLEQMGLSLTARLTLPLAATAVLATKAAADWETSMVLVAKTVDAPAAQLERLGQEFVKLSESIPVSSNELARVASVAGQLGIQTDNLLGFTRVAAAMGVATNLSADDAAVAMARLANVMGTPQTQFDRLGSSIVALGNTTATTEREILEMGLRLAGAGVQVGLTEAEVLGLSAALSSVGIEAEAGGTAFSRIFVELNKAAVRGGDQLERVGRVAGMTGAAFREAFEDDTAEAIVSFVEGLGRMKAEGEDVFGVLEALGMENVRIRDALLRASSAGELLRESVQTGSNAWRENTALTAEAEKFYQRLAGELQATKNMAVNVAAEFGLGMRPGIEAANHATRGLLMTVRSMVREFGQLSHGVRVAVVVFGGMVAAVGPLALGLSSLVRVMAFARIGFSLMLGPVGALSLALTVLAGIFIKNRIEAARMAEAARSSMDAFRVAVTGMQEAELTRQMQVQGRVMERYYAGIETLQARQRQLQQDALDEANEEDPTRFDLATMSRPKRGEATAETRQALEDVEDRLAAQRAVYDEHRQQLEVVARQLNDVRAGMVTPPPLPEAPEVDAVTEAMTDFARQMQAIETAAGVMGDGFDIQRARLSLYESTIGSVAMAGAGLDQQLNEQGLTLRQLGVLWQELAATIDTARESKKAALEVERMAAEVFEQTRTPLERYTAALMQLSDLYNSGSIDHETLVRAVKQAGDALAAELKRQQQRVKSDGELITRALVGGMMDGLDGMAAALQRAIRRLVEDKIVSAITNALGIASPSRVTMYLGEMTGVGFVQGLQGTYQSATRAMQAFPMALPAGIGHRSVGTVSAGLLEGGPVAGNGAPSFNFEVHALDAAGAERAARRMRREFLQTAVDAGMTRMDEALR